MLSRLRQRRAEERYAWDIIVELLAAIASNH